MQPDPRRRSRHSRAERSFLPGACPCKKTDFSFFPRLRAGKLCEACPTGRVRWTGCFRGPYGANPEGHSVGWGAAADCGVCPTGRGGVLEIWDGRGSGLRFVRQAGCRGGVGLSAWSVAHPKFRGCSPTRAGEAGTLGLRGVFCPAHVRAKNGFHFLSPPAAGKLCEACPLPGESMGRGVFGSPMGGILMGYSVEWGAVNRYTYNV